MAGLAAIKGIFGAVLLCSILSFAFILVGLLVHDWGELTYKNDTDGNKSIRSEQTIGLWGRSATPKCKSDECKDNRKAAQDLVGEDSLKKSCQGILKSLDSEQNDCRWMGEGYCRCPYPKGDFTVKSYDTAGHNAHCKAIEEEHGDACAETGKEFAESMESNLTGAVVCLIISLCFILLTLVFAIVGLATSKWIMGPGIAGAILLFLALVLAIVGIVLGTSFVKQQLYSGYCGSKKAWDKKNDSRSDDGKQSDNCFSTGPIFVTVGIVFLFIAVILDCLVTGLGKKISKVVDVTN